MALLLSASDTGKAIVIGLGALQTNSGQTGEGLSEPEWSRGKGIHRENRDGAEVVTAQADRFAGGNRFKNIGLLHSE